MDKISIIEEVLRELSQQRVSAELLAKQNLLDARKKSAGFKKIDDLIREKTVEYASYNKEEDRAKKLLFEIRELKTKRIDELKKIGMTKKDIEPNFDCEKCKDKGFVDGKMCSCLASKVHEKLLKRSGLPTFVGHNFKDSNEKFLEENKTLAKTFELAKIYVEKFPDVKTPNLIFMGDVGVGKTFLLECIASALIEKCVYVVYVTAFNFSNTMLKALTLEPNEREIILSNFLDCDILIIDDMGSEPMYRNLSTANLFTIFNERDIKGKPTLISTNLNFEDFEKRYGTRLFSRIFNKRTARAILFEGKDLRIS